MLTSFHIGQEKQAIVAGARTINKTICLLKQADHLLFLYAVLIQNMPEDKSLVCGSRALTEATLYLCPVPILLNPLWQSLIQHYAKHLF